MTKVIINLSPNLDNIEKITNISIVFLTLILAIAGIVAAFQAYQTNKIKKTPKIVIFIRNDEIIFQALYIIIKNIGEDIAKNINLKLKDSDIKKNKLLPKYLFEETIPLLPPNEEIKSFVLYANDDKKDDDFNFDTKFDIECIFENSNNEKFKQKILISFKHLKEIKKIGKHPIQKLTEAVKEITETIKNINNK